VSDLLPVHPITPADAALIDAWLSDRAGVTREPITDAIVYSTSTNHQPTRDWTEETCRIARMKVEHLAQRIAVPLVRLGLTEGGGFTPDSIRTPIIAYAKDFELRSRPRIAKIMKKLGPEASRLRGPLVWRTKAWWYQVTYCREFYNWLERRGARPQGSNPFVGVNRPAVATISRYLIVEEWFHRILSAKLSPKEECILFLLANGLRCDEIAKLMVVDFFPDQGASGLIRVVGKGSKIREIPLYRRTRLAIDRYLPWHAKTWPLRPMLFPHKFRANQHAHMRPPSIHDLVRRVATRVIQDPEIVPRITPHKFRHYFISDFLHRGGGPTYVRALVGHLSLKTTEGYIHVDPQWLANEVLRMDPDIPREEKERVLAAHPPALLPPRPGSYQLEPAPRDVRPLRLPRESDGVYQDVAGY